MCNSVISISNVDAKDLVSIKIIASWYFEEWQTPVENTFARLSVERVGETLIQLKLLIDNTLVATGGISTKPSILNAHAELKIYKYWVVLLYVKNGYRRKGLGQLLLTALENHAASVGIFQIYLNTFDSVPFYKKHGWTEINQVDYKDKVATIMSKTLKSTI